MTQQNFSARRRQVMAIGTIGASTLAAPAVVMAAQEPAMHFSDGNMVVSGRILEASAGQALAGAQIEIWQADAHGVRAEHTREVAVADGDGRYFVALKGDAQRLHYRVSHQGYTAKVTQLHASAQQSSVTLTRDDLGTARAAFALTLAPRTLLSAATPDYAVL